MVAGRLQLKTAVLVAQSSMDTLSAALTPYSVSSVEDGLSSILRR